MINHRRSMFDFTTFETKILVPILERFHVASAGVGGELNALERKLPMLPDLSGLTALKWLSVFWNNLVKAPDLSGLQAPGSSCPCSWPSAECSRVRVSVLAVFGMITAACTAEPCSRVVTPLLGGRCGQ